ncbi:MAG TPA: chromosomal replication initiator protein DnaA [Gemmatimonadetes bacterium]|nr:chromosomal replication initiator protein DnaA [Gemmatimonadota bacterium]
MELTAAELWARIQESARASIPEHGYLTWVAGAKAVALTSDELQVEVPSRFHVEWLEDKFGPVLAGAAERILGRPLKITASCNAELSAIPVPSIELRPPSPTAAGISPVASPAPAAPRPLLNERYTFERFVVGVNNQLAAAASRAVADKPAKMYNPLFLYGGVGLGKTHLMHAIAWHISARYPERKVIYLSAEKFMYHFIRALRYQNIMAFKEQFRSVDLLMIDDVQFIGGKNSTQEEFFHTFNSIQQAAGQIVLTSDRSPDSISTLEDRLRSRFKMGLVTHIQPPDIETRLAILHKKADVEPGGVRVPDDVLLFIAENFSENIRELEGALTRVTAYSNLNGEACTRDMALTVLNDLISNSLPLPITPALILSKTIDMYNFSHEELIGASRRRPLVTARQVAMYTFRELTDLSYPAIAREFGGRDHTTVIHAVDKIRNLMSERREIYDQVTTLIAAIKTPD